MEIVNSNDSFKEFVGRLGIHLLPDSHVPMYYQLARILEYFIRDGSLQPGDRLPAEESVAECLGVSRATANKAFRELRDRGWISRRQGSGTVIQRKAAPELDHLINLDKLITQYRELGIKTRTVRAEIAKASEAVATVLEIEPGDDVAFLRRVRILQRQPVLVVDCHLSAELFPDFLTTPLVEDSVYATLEQVYGCRVTYSRRWLETGELLRGDIAKLLKVPFLSPVLIMRGITYDARRKPALYLTTYIREGVALTCEVVRSLQPSPRIREAE